MRGRQYCSILLLLIAASPLLAGEGSATAGVVSHIKVTSDKVEDVSSLQAWKQAFIKPGITDQQKALAIWLTVVKFRHQDIPPNEYLGVETHVHDPIQAFNVYGYGQCCCASANIELLARYIGLDTRGWGIVGHSVPEVRVGGSWCMLDASLINYFKRPDGSIAGVEEVSRNIDEWYKQHPQYRGNDGKLRQFMPQDGWKKGPEVLAGSPLYNDNGWLPAATHGWYSNMQEFGSPKKNFLYDYSTAIGYEVNIQLRPGERLVRNWSNKGLHVNMLDGEAPGCLSKAIGQEDLRYAPKFGDLAPGRIGNGTLEYDLPLASGAFRRGMLVAENVAARSEDGAAPAVHVKAAGKPAELIFRMPCSYVYLSGTLTLQGVVGSGGAIDVAFSQNNGLDWKPLAHITESGTKRMDLKALVFRRYDYRLKLTLTGKGTGLDALKVAHDIQHSQRPLPALDKGENHIHFVAGPQEGTITIQGSTDPKAQGKNLLYTDFHPQLTNIESGSMRPTGAKGEVIFPIQTPGDITRLRIGCSYRARDAKDGWTIDASFDDGKIWHTVGELEGGHVGFSKYFVYSDVPPHARAALVRFSAHQRNTAVIFDERISADYMEPNGGFAPVKAIYEWEENGQPKRDVHVAGKEDESYTITCAAKPVMKSIVLELAE